MLERIVLRLDLDVKAEAEFFAYYQSLPRGRRQEFMRNRLRIGEALPESCAGAGVRPQSQDYSAPARRESQVVPASPPAAPTSTDRLDRSVQSTESSAPSGERRCRRGRCRAAHRRGRGEKTRRRPRLAGLFRRYPRQDHPHGRLRQECRARYRR